MLALLAMARCAVLRGVVMTKSGSMLSGERCDLRILSVESSISGT